MKYPDRLLFFTRSKQLTNPQSTNLKHHSAMSHPTKNESNNKASIAPSVLSEETTEWTTQDEARIVRRMDVRLMPLMLIIYLVCFIDSNARILGMATDLHLVGYRFNWAVTAFFFAWTPATIPSSLMLRLFGGHTWIPTMVCSFGLVALCHAFVKTYTGLLVARAFLGACEGGMFGGLAYYLSTFYRRHELALRVAFYVVGASMAGAFGGLLAAGLSEIPAWGIHSMRIHNWRNVFFFEGLLTIILGIAIFFTLPKDPDTCKWLTPSDRYIAGERIRRENREQPIEKIRLYHVYRAVFNINNIICGVTFICITTSLNSVAIYLPTILHDFHWSPIKSQLYSVPPYAVGTVHAFFICWLSDKTRRRGLFIIVNAFTSVVGWAILISHASHSIKYVGIFFAAAPAFSSGPFCIVWGINNAAGPTVRAVSASYIILICSAGNYLGTWIYIPKSAPNFILGHSINLGMQGVVIILACIGIAYVHWENRLRARGGRDYRLDGLNEDQKSELGYRHPDFRYID